MMKSSPLWWDTYLDLAILFSDGVTREPRLIEEVNNSMDIRLTESEKKELIGLSMRDILTCYADDQKIQLPEEKIDLALTVKKWWKNILKLFGIYDNEDKSGWMDPHS